MDQINQMEEVLSGDRHLRIQMALRYTLDGIGSESRINVVFCKIKSESDMWAGKTRWPLLERTEVLPQQFLLWPYAYIVIDLSPGHRKTLAHEIIHLIPFRGHPPPRILYRTVQKHTVIDLGVLGKLGFQTETIKEIPGGFFDGEKNDIMNYSLKDPEPNDVIMNRLDEFDLHRYFEFHSFSENP